MDNIDKKIVSLLQEDARMPLKKLAEKVFLSSPAVSARIEKLEKEGIITSYEVSVNQSKFDYTITAFVYLELLPEMKEEFIPFVQDCDNVLECNCITGNFSMLMKVALLDTDELDTFVGKIQKFGKFNTEIVFSTPVKPRGINVMKGVVLD